MSRTVAVWATATLPDPDGQRQGLRPGQVTVGDDHEAGGGRPLARWQVGGRSLLTMRCPGGDRGLAAGTTVGQQDRNAGDVVPRGLRSRSAGQAAWFIVAKAAMGRQRLGVTMRRPGLVPGRMGRADVQARVVGGR